MSAANYTYDKNGDKVVVSVPTQGELPFTINAREGDPFMAPNGDTVTIASLLQLSSMVDTQEKQNLAFEMIGLKLCDDLVDITFSETGKPYSDPTNDRTKIQAETESENVYCQFTLEQKPPMFVDINYSITPKVEAGVNFFGSVSVAIPGSKQCRVIPLTGRGTIALEGRLNDAHAGFCTGGACASFQVRCAVLLATVAGLGATYGQICQLGRELLKLNDKFHGRDDILYYTCYCASHEGSKQPLTYLSWMKQRYSNKPEMPVQTKSMLEKWGPHPGYYDKVHQKMSREELEQDYIRWVQDDRRKKKSVFKLCFCCWE